MVDPPGLDIIFHILSKLRHSAQRSVFFSETTSGLWSFLRPQLVGYVGRCCKTLQKNVQIIEITTNMYKMPIVSKTNNQAKIVVLAKKTKKWSYSGVQRLFAQKLFVNVISSANKIRTHFLFQVHSQKFTHRHAHVEILTRQSNVSLSTVRIQYAVCISTTL